MSLRSHPGSKALIDSLRDRSVDSLIQAHATDIDSLAHALHIEPSYLSVQVRLLLPFFVHSHIEPASGKDLVLTILAKLQSFLGGFAKYYQKHRHENGIDTLRPESKLISQNGDLGFSHDEGLDPAVFRECDAEIGLEIQRELHYIHKPRADTRYHFGIMLPGRTYPVSYCALSNCDRDYQLGALSTVLDTKLEPINVLVMTRAFGFSPLPKNTMSKLFDSVARSVLRNLDIKYIITAMNPFLGFKGSIFLGSSYVPFATSPMAYNYTEDGVYLNRRSAGTSVTSQRYRTPPIVWLARSVCGAKSQRNLEALTNYYEIKPTEYRPTEACDATHE